MAQQLARKLPDIADFVGSLNDRLLFAVPKSPYPCSASIHALKTAF